MFLQGVHINIHKSYSNPSTGGNRAEAKASFPLADAPRLFLAASDLRVF